MGPRRRFIARATSSRLIRVALALVLPALLLAWWVVPAAAESGQIFALAPKNPANTPPWRVEIDTTWVEANGYRPVKVSIAPLPPIPIPTKRQYSVVVELRPWNYYGDRTGTVVSKAFDLPQGADDVTETILVPMAGAWSMFEAKVFVDGIELDELNSNFGIGGVVAGPSAGSWPEGNPSVLIIDSNAPPRFLRTRLAMPTPSASTEASESRLPDPSALMSTIGSFQNTSPGLVSLPNGTITPFPSLDAKNITDTQILNLVRMSSRVMLAPPSDLEPNWLALTPFDITLVSLEELRKMVRDEPARWGALRRWVAAGQTLCVWGVGDQFERLAELEKLLELPRLSPDVESSGGWVTTPEAYANQVFSDLLIAPNQNLYFAPGMAAPVPTPPPAKPQAAAVDRRSPGWLRMRPLALGRVVAMAAENPFPGSSRDWSYLLATIGQENWRWYWRHGVSLYDDNADFHNYDIANVGRPPVITFLGLISVFAIVIGPVNYLWLNRRRRLYLLLVTVPLGAGIVTTCLLLYAIVADGLHTRIRIRSVTYLDQRAKEAVSWSRQSYYAGLAPSRGLTFPDDTAVYPIHRWWAVNESRHLLQWDEAQHLTRGYLPSRTITQLLTVRARPSEAKLEVREPKQSDEPLRVTNGLGTPVELLVVRDRQGRHQFAESVGAGDSVTLQPIEDEPLGKMLLAAYRRHDYEMEVVTYDNIPPRSRWRVYRPSSSSGGPVNASSTTSILERALSRWDVTRDHLAPREFLALVPRGPEVPVGVPKVYEEGSLHLIFGNW